MALRRAQVTPSPNHMTTKLIYCAAAAAFALGLTACDEDNDQLIDLEFNDEQLLVSSNTTAKLVKLQTADLSDVERVDITLPYSDVDGIGLRGTDLLIANRDDDQLVLLSDVFDGENEDAADVETRSDVTVTNARGVAVDRELGGANVVIAQAGNDDNGGENKLFRFDANRSDLDLQAEIRVDFQLWGIEWDGDDLIAVMDQTDSVAVFEDFDDAVNTGDSAFLQPTYKFRVEGLTRTHGVAFAQDDDLLFLTDIGDAGSDTDGAVHVIPNWRAAARGDVDGNEGTLALGRQVRIAGSETFLGNPVDVAYDDDNNNLFVAERARDGGRVIAFDMEDISDFLGQTIQRAVIFNEEVAGAASVEYKD